MSIYKGYEREASKSTTLVVRKSPITNKVHAKIMPITIKQLNVWKNGASIQDVFPDLSAGDREFILTGITDEEWNDIFKGDEE